MKKIFALLITGITAGAAWCCVSPSNIEGVAFTSGEIINLTNLTSLGTNGTNILRDSSDAGIAVRYRSHYSNDAMVFVGSYGLAYQKSVSLNCMGIITDPEKTGSSFNYAQAVKTELEWMLEQGVISIDNQTIAMIYDSLDKTDHGGVQYWTLQKRVLGYNSWYVKDSLSGVWNTDGVNGVRSVKGAACAGINPEYKDFAQALAVVPVTNLSSQSATRFSITRNAGTTFTIMPWSNTDNITIINASGKICPVHPNSVSGGIIVSFDNQVSPGVYFLKLGRSGTVQTVPILISR